MGLLETSSSFIIRSFSLGHRSYKRITCDCRGNYPNREVQYCHLRSIKQDLGTVECVFYTSVHVKKVTGTLPAMCERDRPTESRVSSSSWQAGWLAVIQDILGGANSIIQWDDKQILCVFCCSFWPSEVSTISLTHSRYAVQKYPLFKYFVKTQQRLLTRHEILCR